VTEVAAAANRHGAKYFQFSLKDWTMARRQGVFSELLDFSSKLPWQASVGLAVASAVKRWHSWALRKVARANPKVAIASMSWRDFERLVGEIFRRQGFTVTGFGGNGPDGGVDLGLSKNGQRFLVQCKHWRKRQVGVTMVRELNGVIAAQRAHGGFVVTGGQFTREAREFADSCAIKLIDGPALDELMGGLPARPGMV
jgi:restriction system protein